LAIGVGLLVLVGWTFDIDILKGAGHTITMKPNAAVGLIASGLSLIAAAASRAPWTGGAMTLAALVALTGGLTLSEHLAGWDLQIDQLLFEEPPGAAATASPGRMGPNASTSLMLIGIALLGLHRRTRRGAVVAQWLALVTATFATVALLGYLYGAQELYSASRFTGIAWPTAVALLVLALGVLFARPQHGPTSAIVSTGPGGVMARQMLVFAIAMPLVLGYVRVRGERALLYDTGLGSALVAVTMIVVFAVAIWRTALKLDATNLARAAAQRERDDLLMRERAAREEAERASRLKDEFLATLSHELRTPLNVILGWTEALRNGSLPEDRRGHAAAVVARNGRVLARLVEDLLDISRISTERVRLQMQPVDVIRVASAAITAIDTEATAKGVRLVSRLDGASGVVVGDPERLQQIVGNLLSNAVKFTPAGGTVGVDAHVLPSTVELRVRDTGQGIAPEFLPHVFERFRQEDATTTRQHGGLGLGLSIVRELTELHGGSVSVASDGHGRGATFTVTLPLITADQRSLS
jgi:signal transduction histidine kinase